MGLAHSQHTTPASCSARAVQGHEASRRVPHARRAPNYIIQTTRLLLYSVTLSPVSVCDCVCLWGVGWVCAAPVRGICAANTRPQGAGVAWYMLVEHVVVL